MYVGTAHFLIIGASLRASVYYVLYQFLRKNSWQKNVNQEIKIFITSCAIHTCQSAIKSCLCLMLIKCLFSGGLRFQQQLVGTCCMAASWPHSHLLKFTILLHNLFMMWVSLLCRQEILPSMARTYLFDLWQKRLPQIDFLCKTFLLSCHLFDPRFSPISLVAQQRYSKCFSHKSSRP